MKKIIALLLGIVLITFAFFHYNKESLVQNDKLFVEDFKGKNDSNKIQAAINKAESSKIKTVLLDDKKYKITSPIIVKQGVKLLFGYGTQFVVEGNFRVLELEKNASIEGAYIAIDDPKFNSEVIYLDGKNKYYNTWNKTQVKDINIINWTETNKGTGISLYSGGKENEISGNQFTNLQIQPSSKTKNILRVSGQHNEFNAMVWDLNKINHENELIELTDKSMNTVIDITSVPTSRVLDSGKANIVK
ncbi:hypothetical protein [Bacillus mycoides]|uniref:hypothetical protein n=1 Tax=Bacillus mycoides TaxID=1405 RepID=UPI00187ADA70|nr:hypothetical protein [Bacillus mycoides]MBE7129484.1 hypothetical protein [Bacillus mycoides]